MMEIKQIGYKQAVDFLLPRHYSGRKPPVTWAFGWYDNGRLMAVCTFGKPASNTLCDGVTKQRTEKWTEGNKHSRHYSNDEQGEFRKIRTAKHRYVYFCTSDKKIKREWAQELRYPVCPYPKGDNNADYQLGYVMPVQLVKIREAKK